MSRRRGQQEGSADLKKEVDTLRRQLARLRRENERLRNEGTEESPDEDVEIVPSCPKCGSDQLAQVTTPSGKKISSCRACKKWRSRPA